MQRTMRSILRPLANFFVLVLMTFSLAACSPSPTAGLETFQSNDGRYAFLYPTGWTRIALQDGPELVFHDLINSDETLSLVISDLPNEVQLESIGTPLEVGEKIMNNLFAADGDGRSAELLKADSRTLDDRVFYDIEYMIHLPGRDRHEIATVVVDRGSLFTFAAGTKEDRWGKVDNLFKRVVTSFNFNF